MPRRGYRQKPKNLSPTVEVACTVCGERYAEPRPRGNKELDRVCPGCKRECDRGIRELKSRPPSIAPREGRVLRGAFRRTKADEEAERVPRYRLFQQAGRVLRKRLP